MEVMGFHGVVGWMPPAAAWGIGERSQTKNTQDCVVSFVCDRSPISQSVGNADGLQPYVSVSPSLPVKKGVDTP